MWAAVFEKIEAVATKNGGTSSLGLRIRDFVLVDGLGEGNQDEFLEGLLRFLLRFKEFRFTYSRLSAGAMDGVLRALAAGLAEQRAAGRVCVCERVGLGIQPHDFSQSARESSAALIHPASIWRLLRELAKVLGTRRALVINVHRLWGERFAVPGCAFLLHVLSAQGQVLEVVRDGTGGSRGKSRGKSEQHNPLSRNPFIPGLCRVKQVAFAGWKRLISAQSLAAALHPETLPFLRTLAASWRLCEIRLSELPGGMPTDLQAALRVARGFLKKLEPLCGGAEIALLESSSLVEFDNNFERQLRQVFGST